jgi:hypothetical protein
MTITGDLLIPQTLMQGVSMPDLERQLQAYGLLPVQAEQRRWRLDAEFPGSYRLSFVLTVPVADAEER